MCALQEGSWQLSFITWAVFPSSVAVTAQRWASPGVRRAELSCFGSSCKGSGSGFCPKGVEKSVYKPQPFCLGLSLLEQSKVLAREAVSVSFYSACC